MIIEENGFKYIEKGEGEVLLFLHGLFGALSNWESPLEHFSKSYKVIIPMMPIYELPVKKSDLSNLVVFIEDFVRFKKLDKITIAGNSLGGHVGLLYSIRNKAKVRRMVLLGSSGLFENGMGGSYPKRGSYEYVKERVSYTFYNPDIASKELIDEVFNITNDIQSCLRMINFARSAQRHNVSDILPELDMPTLLIWGLNDTITPPATAHEFNRLLPKSELRFIDKCCHVPMMEHPQLFNHYFDDFLKRNPID